MNLTEVEYQTALTTVRTAAAVVGAEVAVMFEKNIGPADKSSSSSTEPTTATTTPASTAAEGEIFKMAYVMIRKTPKSVEELLELRVAVVGNVVCTIGMKSMGRMGCTSPQDI